MRLHEIITVMVRLDNLIRMKATGSPDQLAARLNVSRTTIHRYLNELRNFGAPIKYCRYRNSYYYEEEFQLKFI